MAAKKDHVRYTAAAAVIRLTNAHSRRRANNRPLPVRSLPPLSQSANTGPNLRSPAEGGRPTEPPPHGSDRLSSGVAFVSVTRG